VNDDELSGEGRRGRCSANTVAGTPCQQWENPRGSGRCIWHGPKEVARAARAAGGEKTRELLAERRASEIDATDPPPVLRLSLEGVAAQLGWVTQQVSSGRMAPKVGSTVVYGLSNLRAALVASDLEAELKAAKVELAKLRSRLGRGAA
jgi:hypothetical protein